MMTLKQFKYWLRIKGFRPEWFGTGEKRNPIKLKSKKEMKIVTIMCLLAMLAGCTPQKVVITSKPNRFVKQFQQADSAFNKQYGKEEGYGKLL